MKLIALYKVLLCFTLTFGLLSSLVFAQDSDSHQHEADGNNHSEDKNADDEHNESMDHSDHAMTDMDSSEAALNTFMLAGQHITLDPLVLPDGSFQIGLRLSHDDMDSEMAMDDNKDSKDGEAMADHGMTMMPALTVVTPAGETLSPMMVHGSRMDVMTFPIGLAMQGIYRVNMMLADEMLSVPMGVYTASSDITHAFLILAPNPSLSSRGESQSFLYAFQEGEAIHDDLMLRRSMAGMQHMTDAEELAFSHTHFDDIYDDAIGTKPMSNELDISFAMAGSWDVTVMLMGDLAETFEFSVEVLNE